MMTTSQAAKALGVHPNTLRAWTDKGLVRVTRLPSGYRRFTDEQVAEIRTLMLAAPDSRGGRLTQADSNPRGSVDFEWTPEGWFAIYSGAVAAEIARVFGSTRVLTAFGPEATAVEVMSAMLLAAPKGEN